jgi:hypothetical protein
MLKVAVMELATASHIISLDGQGSPGHLHNASDLGKI